MASSIPHRAPPQSAAGLPFLRLGFRPFYFGAALFGAVSMALWYAIFFGHVDTVSRMPAVLWHGHEMLFGFAAAVIVGFLLTAGKAWTGLPTPRGASLAALFALWAAGRVAALAAPYPIFFALDALFLPVIATLFITLLLRAGNKRNLKVGGVLALLAVANLAFHLGASGMVALDATRALYGGLALIVLLETIIAGRVIPSFTMNATPGLSLPASPQRDIATGILTGLGLAFWVFDVLPQLGAALLAAAALLHLVRWSSWKPWVTFTRPILWILHLAYLWIPVGLILLSASRIGWVTASAGVHALAVGATGGLIIGMITRTARGHTGRPLAASSLEAAAFAMMLLAAAVRVGAPSLWPSIYLESLVAAGVLWIAALALYLFRYTPWLMTARLDGKDG